MMNFSQKMFRSSLVPFMLSLAILASPLSVPREASAQIGINIGVGSSLNRGRPISCPQGERLLRGRGFRDINRENCRGRFFNYRASRNGQRFEVAIRQSDGRIVDMRRTSRRW
ncbi:hypothetical protein QTL94_00175 [Rhizobium sp. S96]|nr:hypothetical protein [Rhizobium sp. S96]